MNALMRCAALRCQMFSSRVINWADFHSDLFEEDREATFCVLIYIVFVEVAFGVWHYQVIDYALLSVGVVVLEE